jgi:hypothetical protein
MKFLVQRKGLSYNDESYDFEEGGVPVSLHNTIESAREAKLKLTREFLEYNNSISDFVECGDFDRIKKGLEKIFGINKTEFSSEWEVNVPKGSIEQQNEVIAFLEKEFGLEFFDIFTMKEED